MPGPSAEKTEALEACERLEDQSDWWAEPSCDELGWDELACDEPDFTRLTSRHRGAVRDRGYPIKPTARLLGDPRRSRLRQVLATGRDSPGAIIVRSGWPARAEFSPPMVELLDKIGPEKIGMDRLVILSREELARTLDRLASQVLEVTPNSSRLVLVGIPTRGVALADVLAGRLEALCGHPVDQGRLDPTFHRDDLERVGTRLVQATDLPAELSDRHVVLVDDVIFTGRTVRAALEALQAWGRPGRVSLLVMVDRGHRELPIQPDFCGRVVPTSRQESIQVCLMGIDGEEGVLLLRP